MDSHEQRQVMKDSEEEELYESDSEEGTSALGLRRRAGSDDEEDGHRRTSYYNEDVVENQGAPPREDDDDDKEDDEEGEDQCAHDNDVEISEVGFSEPELLKLHREDTGVLEGKESSKDRGEEEKKDAEPFVVPTAGAFYMHDDRFRADGVTRTRRSAGGRKLWEAKDEKPWLHDRFEELKLREDNYYGQDARGRRGRGRQGRVQGNGRASMHARGRGSKEQMTEDTTPQFISRNGHGRGRGLRRAKMDDYEFKDSRSAGNRVLPSSSRENSTTATALKPPALQNISKSQESASKKPTTSSILNSASPPFFPTGAKSHNLDGVLSSANKGADDKVFEKDATPISKVVNTSNSGMEKVIAPGPLRSSSNPGNLTNLGLTSNTEAQSHSDVNRNAARAPSTMQQQLIITGPRPMLHQDRPVSTKHLIEQAQVSSAPQPNKGTRPPTRSMHVQHGVQLQRISQVQASQSQAEPEQSQQSASRSTISVADVKTAPGSVINKSGAGGGTQATTVQAGRGTFVYGGSSLTNGLRNGVQFPGQPQPGLGVQMALPGYSNQNQFGFENSEVTWIPILAGGSVGSNYSSPYISVDGTSAGVYYTAQASQSSSFIRGEPAGAKTGASASFKPPARTEPEDLGQQRKRYSQMTFSEERS